jgi:hypothetical protein
LWFIIRAADRVVRGGYVIDEIGDNLKPRVVKGPNIRLTLVCAVGYVLNTVLWTPK